MEVTDLHFMLSNVSPQCRGITYAQWEQARDALIAFLSAPIPTCQCGMFRAGQTFENWNPRCLDGAAHDPQPSYR